MKSKNKAISLRLSNEEYTKLESNSNNLNMSISKYIRSIINDTLPSEINYRQYIAPMVCKIQIRLSELGLEDEEIAKEVKYICQILS